MLPSGSGLLFGPGDIDFVTVALLSVSEISLILVRAGTIDDRLAMDIVGQTSGFRSVRVP